MDIELRAVGLVGLQIFRQLPDKFPQISKSIVRQIRGFRRIAFHPPKMRSSTPPMTA
jgi:hypothetical protein